MYLFGVDELSYSMIPIDYQRTPCIQYLPNHTRSSGRGRSG